MFAPGLCESLLDVILKGERNSQLVLSEYILEEFRRNAIEKFRVPPEKVRVAIELIRIHSEIVAPIDIAEDACSDPTDLQVLGTAIGGTADLLVTGDALLHKLGSIQDILIVTPRACYEALIR